MSEENWYPSEEEYTPNLSKDDWIRLLQDEKIFDYNSMCLMRRMKDIGGQATFTQLAEKYGESADHYAGITTPLAKRISENSNCNNPPKGKNGYVKTWSILFLFKDVKNDKAIDGSYICKLRPELSTALDEIDLTKYELYEGKENMNTFQDDCLRFKKLLEFFVAYLNYTIYNSSNERYKKTDTIGYKEYIKPIVKDLSFSGQGYKGHRIQDPIKNVDTYNGYRIFINSNAQIRPSSNDYLNWEKTAYNIICKWNKGIVSRLQYVERISKEDSDKFKIAETRCLSDDVSISELGLFDNRNPNKALKNFYVSYYKKFNDDLYNKLKKELEMDKIESYKNLLEANRNLILTGAPGTGKTHLAKEIAKAMGCTDDEIGFVQFHPSYDYTDFVEGLRPDPDNDGSKDVSFIRMDGVFKKFCAKALKANFSSGVDNFEEAWEKLVEYLNENDCLDVQLLSGKSNFRVELNEYGDGLANRTYENDDFEKGNWVKGKSKFFSKEQLYNIYKGLKGVPKGGHDNYRKAVVAKMKSDFGLKDYKVGTETDKKKNFVFIIDEINRGEISKIFGELFFSIDPGYRGTSGKVQTQYQNLVEEGDDFFDGFFVPENVYIIGTMNDIDRSVESMDFAFRRRFVFKEVSAEESAENMGITNPAMKRINDEIAKPENELGKDYQLGGAYFLDDMTDQERWDLKISRLIKEYLRGIDPNGEKFQAIENAYFGKKQDDEDQDEASD